MSYCMFVRLLHYRGVWKGKSTGLETSAFTPVEEKGSRRTAGGRPEAKVSVPAGCAPQGHGKVPCCGPGSSTNWEELESALPCQQWYLPSFGNPQIRD